VKGEKSQREREANREVSPEVCAALGELPLPVDWSRVRVYREGCGGGAARARRLVLWLSRGRAVALGNHVFLPARCDGDLALMAHEMTHCGQYQSWGPWRYFTRGAAAQVRDLLHRRLGCGRSPYAYEPAPGRPFDAYGMEEQAQIAEDALRGSAAARAITGAGRARAK
jgi:Domain of unknown function (DUF4157)